MSGAAPRPHAGPQASATAESTASLREHLAQLLDWRDAHAAFDAAVDGLPTDKQGVVPPGLPHSPWQLLEHIRLAQLDILEFCTDPDYNQSHKNVKWPDDYWPDGAAPPDAASWDRSVAACREDRAALIRLVRDDGVNLFAEIPHGTGQTYLREALLVADHTAYHVGQLILVRRLLGAWT